MRYFSLAHASQDVDFRTATLLGQAPDKGLYFPENIPVWEPSFISSIRDIGNEEMAFRVMAPYVGDCIPEDTLRRIVGETLSFSIPLVRITENISALELFHGPTLAFKDVGARFMSRCLGHFAQDRDRRAVVLVATSGDTGGAVANGFFDVPGVDVVILYPSGRVSPVQEKQLTTLGRNIHALEIEGNFDDCQRMVKTAFADVPLTKRIFLTSANSINVARWLPQQLYYIIAHSQWQDDAHPPVISVPSGNFGNICAGLLARRSGLPVKHFIAACNANDTIPRFMRDGEYLPEKAKATISNAMDVADPSNFIRILQLFGHSREDLSAILSSVSITDEETKETIGRIHRDTNYLTDPHGAVACLALERWIGKHPGSKGYFLGTAHPVKFPESVEDATGIRIPVPAHVIPVMQGVKNSTLMPADPGALVAFLSSFA
jgi:threonine synthase